MSLWITLLFLGQVCCEWVQISQQHYRKPYRPLQAYNHPVLAEDTDFEYEEDTTTKTNRIYANSSMYNYKWKDNDLPFNNKGFITKVEAVHEHLIHDDKIGYINNVVKHSNIQLQNEKEENISDEYAFKFNNRGHHAPDEKSSINDRVTITPAKNRLGDHTPQDASLPHNIPKIYELGISESPDVFEESYHIIPNVGSIKKVHLDSRTVRTPILKESSKKQFGSNPAPNIKPSVSENHYDKETKPSRPILIWKNENQTKKTVPGIIQKISKEDLERKFLINNSRNEETALTNKDHSKNENIFMTHVVHRDKDISGEEVKLNKLPDINFEKPVFVTNEEFEDEGLVTITSDTTTDFPEDISKSTQKSTTEIPQHVTKEKNTQDKVNTMDNVLKFMRIVTDIISRNTRRSVGSKVRYLENLQDTIMANIEHRIDTLWPDDTGAAEQPAGRSRRAATPRGGGHVEFPSSESALMTISFLTFAVYLIKLVLQVIHTYKNKAMMLTPAVVTAVGRTVAAVYRRSDNT